MSTIALTVIIVYIIAIGIIVYGVSVFKGKIPFIDHFLNYVSSEDPRVYKSIGTVLVIIGIAMLVSPFIFGFENMHI